MTRTRRLLVVEDEMLIAMLLENILQELGFEVAATVPSVAKALKVLVRDDAIDAAFLDVNLAGIKSFEVAEELGRRNIPYAFVTGYGLDIIKPSLSQVPVVRKPFDETAIQAVLIQILGDPAV